MPQLLKEKWLSALHHIINIHQWASNDLFHRSVHEPYSDDNTTDWLEINTPAYKVLSDIISKPRLLNDLKQMTLFKHTGVILQFMLRILIDETCHKLIM